VTLGTTFEREYRHAMERARPVAFEAYYPAPSPNGFLTLAPIRAGFRITAMRVGARILGGRRPHDLVGRRVPHRGERGRHGEHVHADAAERVTRDA